MNLTDGWCPGSKAAYSNENSSYATVPNITITNRDFTIAFWIKFFSIDGPILAVRSISGKLFCIGFRGSAVFLSVYNKLEKEKFKIGDWNHLAVTCEQFEIKVFVNGTERAMPEQWSEYFFLSSEKDHPYFLFGDNPDLFKVPLMGDLIITTFLGSVMSKGKSIRVLYSRTRH